MISYQKLIADSSNITGYLISMIKRTPDSQIPHSPHLTSEQTIISIGHIHNNIPQIYQAASKITGLYCPGFLIGSIINNQTQLLPVTCENRQGS